jgi:hypothetical protein
MTWTRAPAHLLAASLCVGLVLANAGRLHGVALAGSVAAAVAELIGALRPLRILLLETRLVVVFVVGA